MVAGYAAPSLSCSWIDFSIVEASPQVGVLAILAKNTLVSIGNGGVKLVILPYHRRRTKLQVPLVIDPEGMSTKIPRLN